MRAVRYSTAFAVLFFLVAGVIYSAVCDASCTLYGCTLLLQESASKNNDPHAHCHSRDKAGSKTASKQHDIAKSSLPQRHEGDGSPACASHLYASALIPRVGVVQVVSHAQALISEAPQIALAWIPNLSAETVKVASFRPPDLAMLSVLPI